MSCDECEEAYKGEPPCDECEHEPLKGYNAMPWQIWVTCHRYGRDGMNGMLRLDSVLTLCDRLGASEEDMELVLSIENEVWPRIKPDG